MSNRDAIYDYQYRLEDAYRVLERSSIDEDSKALVRAFVEQLRAQGVSIGRQAKYIFNLKVIGEVLGVGFREATRADVERLMTSLRSRGYSPNTLCDFVMVIKRFWKFVKAGNVDREEPYPSEVRWLRKTIKPNERRQPEFLIGEEVKKMIDTSHLTYP
jgi:site-specific recombinase XerD